MDFLAVITGTIEHGFENIGRGDRLPAQGRRPGWRLSGARSRCLRPSCPGGDRIQTGDFYDAKVIGGISP
jgi:hypothetical protein